MEREFSEAYVYDFLVFFTMPVTVILQINVDESL